MQLPPYSEFWAAKWEVVVFRPFHVRPRRSTDQWIQPPQTVKLVALWVCVRDASEMQVATPVSRPWDPAKETCPMTHQAFQSASHRLDREFPTWTAHKAYSGNQPACALKGSRQLKYSLLSTQGLSAKEDHAVAIYSELTAKLATAVALDLRGGSVVSAGGAADVLLATAYTSSVS